MNKYYGNNKEKVTICIKISVITKIQSYRTTRDIDKNYRNYKKHFKLRSKVNYLLIIILKMQCTNIQTNSLFFS